MINGQHIGQPLRSSACRFAESPQVFSSTCGSLLARMLDTVPRGVQLTQVITPLPVKPSGLDLVLDGDVLKFSGEVRVCSES
jgi:hypothetical protein